MTLVPPQGTILGQLEIDEVYFEHDGPRFFSAVSRSGRRFIAIAVDEDDDTDTYLYLPVSQPRFEMLRSGGFTLRRALLEPEDGYVFRVIARYSEPQGNQIDLLSPEEIPVDWLPAENAALRIPTQTRPRFDPQAIVAEARQQGRTLLAVEVDPPSMLRTEYSLRSLSRLAASVQDAVDAFAQEVRGRPTARGAIQSDILQSAELAFEYALAASFVLVLAAPLDDYALIQDPLAGQAATSIAELLEAGKDDALFRQKVADYGPRARSKFRTLLETLTDEDTGVAVVIAPPFGEMKRAELSAPLVRSSLLLLRQVDTEVSEITLDRVTIVGVHLRTGSFELFDNAAGKRYPGKMEPEAREQITGLPTGDEFYYTATLLQELERSNVSSEERPVYRLLSIRPRTTS